jgi:DNA modification methylase
VSVELLHGDCVELMRAMPECSVDSIVTDPPYGLEFMGKEWDAPWKSARSSRYGRGHQRHLPHQRFQARRSDRDVAFQEASLRAS